MFQNTTVECIMYLFSPRCYISPENTVHLGIAQCDVFIEHIYIVLESVHFIKVPQFLPDREVGEYVLEKTRVVPKILGDFHRNKHRPFRLGDQAVIRFVTQRRKPGCHHHYIVVHSLARTEEELAPDGIKRFHPNQSAVLLSLVADNAVLVFCNTTQYIVVQIVSCHTSKNNPVHYVIQNRYSIQRAV